MSRGRGAVVGRPAPSDEPREEALFEARPRGSYPTRRPEALTINRASLTSRRPTVARLNVEKNGVLRLVLEFEGDEAAKLLDALRSAGVPVVPAVVPGPPPLPSPNG